MNRWKRYKVIFHHGNELGLKTRITKGEVWIDDAGLNIKGPNEGTSIPKADFRTVEMFRLYGMSRVIRIDHSGGRLFLAVVRFTIGQFASVNFLQTGKLHKAHYSLLDSN